MARRRSLIRALYRHRRFGRTAEQLRQVRSDDQYSLFCVPCGWDFGVGLVNENRVEGLGMIASCTG